MKFSQRIGITPAAKKLQLESIDDELRAGLWNVLCNSFFEEFKGSSSSFLSDEERSFANILWHEFFKLNVKSIPIRRHEFDVYLEKWFFNAEWYEVYDFIEYCCCCSKSTDLGDYVLGNLLSQFNVVLEREFSGYKIIDNIIAPISNSHEVQELEDTFALTDSFSALRGCNIHLRTALMKLSDRSRPDYRNSIKESISAVESLAKIIAQRPNDSLGASLDRIKGAINLHPSLERGFKQIYGYASDEGGIRHALMDSPNCEFEDAKFMLISCSAFINYLIVKANKAGISLT